MTRPVAVAILIAAVAAAMHSSAAAQVPGAGSIAGRWALDRAQSQLPQDVGFEPEWLSQAAAGEPGGGGRGRRGGGGGESAPNGFPRPQSQDDARRVDQLTGEARSPSTRLTIVDAGDTVTITDDRGRSRTFHPDLREEILQLDDAPVTVSAKRDDSRVIVNYRVETGREMRYTYSRNGAQLLVDLQLLVRGRGDTVRRVYGPADPGDSMRAPDPPPAPARPAAAGADPSGAGVPAVGGVPAAGGAPATVDSRPDAELRRLSTLGVVIERLNSQASACGLTEKPIEEAVIKRLTDGGFTVKRDSDEDSYVYVEINTASVSNGLCVSRFDVSIMTHTAATLSYQDRPVLVLVQLLHMGGMAGGGPTAHAEGVLKSVQEYLDQFVTRIHGANK